MSANHTTRMSAVEEKMVLSVIDTAIKKYGDDESLLKYEFCVDLFVLGQL